MVVEAGAIGIADRGIRLEAIWSHHSKTPENQNHSKTFENQNHSKNFENQNHSKTLENQNHVNHIERSLEE